MSKARDLADLAKNANDRLDTVATSDGALSNRNLIINGAMQVAQRGASFTGVQTGAYQIDRWKSLFSGVSTKGIATVTQSTDAPSGFSHSYKMEVTTADTSLDPWAEYVVQQRIEGQNLAALKKGTADAESVTVSFWVKSSTTGTYILEILDNQNSSRHINKSYTINAANTWEYKTLTFAGDTSGTLTYNNTVSLELNWCLAGGSNFTGGALQTSWGSLVQSNRKVGQLNLYATNGNTWQITGVQLEVGDTATPFEHRSYGDELVRCQRYFISYPYVDSAVGAVAYAPYAHGHAYSSDTIYAAQQFPTTMRVAPTFSSTGNHRAIYRNQGDSGGSLFLFDVSQTSGLLKYESTSTPFTIGEAAWISQENDADARLLLDAEL